MSKRAAAGIGVAAVMLVTLMACVFATPWDQTDGGLMNEQMTTIEYGTHDGITTDGIFADFENSLNYKVFEEYGPLLIVLGALMFGAMVGGICIAREEDESNDRD